MEKFLDEIENIDEELFVKQKTWLIYWSMKGDEYATGLLNLLDCIQDYCERTCSKKFYFSDEINSDISLMINNMIERNISKEMAEVIYRKVNRAYHEEDVNMYTEVNLPDKDIQSITDRYEKLLENSGEWYEYVQTAIEQWKSENAK